jgi:hypothetical protein
MADGRLNNGGARPGAGRKSDALRVQLQSLIDDAISEDDWREIFKMLSCFARAGNFNAAALLLDRKFGKAPQVVEIDEPEGPTVDLTKLSQEDLGTIADILRKASSEPGDPGTTADPAGDRGGAETPAVPAGPGRLRKRGAKGRFMAEAD